MGRVTKNFLIMAVLLINSCGLIDKSQDQSVPIENKTATAALSNNDKVSQHANTEVITINTLQLSPTMVESVPVISQAQEPQVIVVEKPTKLSQVVEAYPMLDTLQSTQLKQQRTETKQRYDNTQEAIAGIKYVLLLLCCKEREKNRQEVLQILDKLRQQLTTSSDKIYLLAFTQLVRQLVGDIVDLEGVTQQTKVQLATKNAHIKRLEEQINALKSIEKSIHEREVGADAANSP